MSCYNGHREEWVNGHKTSPVMSAIFISMGCTILLIVCLLTVDFLLGTGILIPPRALPAEQDPLLEMAWSRVQIGDERNDAVQVLSDAWFHAECRSADSTTIRDLFFYGPHNRDDVKIVLVVSEEVDNTTSVVFVGGVENYMLHLYDHCIPPLPQAFGEIPTIIATP